MSCQNVFFFFFKHLYLFSEVLKEADSVKTRSLQMLKEANNKLTQELDNNHKGQSELVKVQHVFILKMLQKYTSIRTFCVSAIGCVDHD